MTDDGTAWGGWRRVRLWARPGGRRQGVAFPRRFHVKVGLSHSKAVDPGGTLGHAAPLRTVGWWAIVGWRRPCSSHSSRHSIVSAHEPACIASRSS
jgi:hypothetical protein